MTFNDKFITRTFGDFTRSLTGWEFPFDGCDVSTAKDRRSLSFKRDHNKSFGSADHRAWLLAQQRAAAERQNAATERRDAEASGSGSIPVREELKEGLKCLQGGDLGGAQARFKLVIEAEDPCHPDVLLAKTKLAEILWRQGDLSGARPLLEEAMLSEVEMLGREHPWTLRTRRLLAIILGQQEHFRAAELELRAVATTQQLVLGSHSMDTVQTHCSLAELLFQQGKFKSTAAELEEFLPYLVEVCGDGHLDVRTIRSTLASSLRRSGDPEGAKAVYQAMMRTDAERWGVTHWEFLGTCSRLAEVLGDLEEHAEAAEIHSLVFSVHSVQLGPDHPLTRTAELSRDYDIELLGAQQERRAAEAAAEAAARRGSRLDSKGHHQRSGGSGAPTSDAMTSAGRKVIKGAIKRMMTLQRLSSGPVLPVSSPSSSSIAGDAEAESPEAAAAAAQDDTAPYLAPFSDAGVDFRSQRRHPEEADPQQTSFSSRSGGFKLKGRIIGGMQSVATMLTTVQTPVDFSKSIELPPVVSSPLPSARLSRGPDLARQGRRNTVGTPEGNNRNALAVPEGFSGWASPARPGAQRRSLEDLPTQLRPSQSAKGQKQNGSDRGVSQSGPQLHLQSLREEWHNETAEGADPSQQHGQRQSQQRQQQSQQQQRRQRQQQGQSNLSYSRGESQPGPQLHLASLREEWHNESEEGDDSSLQQQQQRKQQGPSNLSDRGASQSGPQLHLASLREEWHNESSEDEDPSLRPQQRGGQSRSSKSLMRQSKSGPQLNLMVRPQSWNGAENEGFDSPQEEQQRQQQQQRQGKMAVSFTPEAADAPPARGGPASAGMPLSIREPSQNGGAFLPYDSSDDDDDSEPWLRADSPHHPGPTSNGASGSGANGSSAVPGLDSSSRRFSFGEFLEGPSFDSPPTSLRHALSLPVPGAGVPVQTSPGVMRFSRGPPLDTPSDCNTPDTSFHDLPAEARGNSPAKPSRSSPESALGSDTPDEGDSGVASEHDQSPRAAEQGGSFSEPEDLAARSFLNRSESARARPGTPSTPRVVRHSNSDVTNEWPGDLTEPDKGKRPVVPNGDQQEVGGGEFDPFFAAQEPLFIVRQPNLALSKMSLIDSRMRKQTKFRFLE